MYHANTIRRFFIRLLNWEYWPGHWLYIPLIPYFLYLALRHRHPCFFTAANPGVYTGGLGMESKYKTLLLIPEHLRPLSVFVPHGQAFEVTLQALRSTGIAFPLIAKPDIGFRGLLVKKIDSEHALWAHLSAYPIDFIIQEFADLAEEVGVLYYRHPNESQGRITSITQKEFLSITGDGYSTIRALMEKEARTLLHLDRLKREGTAPLDRIPARGERVCLEVIGNHSKGTAFINGNHLIDERIQATFDNLSQQIAGFNYGRYDLKCQSFADLRKGKNFKVIELNGVCAEPTHIYDAQKTSYFQALAALIHHWGIIGKIAAANNQKGSRYMNPKAMIRAIWELQKYSKKIRA